VKVPEGYAIETVLSAGPTAFVALARALAPALARGGGGGSGVECVLKLAAIERAVPMLQNEASVLQALGEAGVAGVPRLLETWSDGFALERLRIPTLRALGPHILATPALADAVARRAFERLADVHSARDAWNVPLRVVHGDVSPDNLYVAADASRAVLADFALARWRDARGADSGAFRGTLLYAAPEVARGEPFDARADDFALAASVLHVCSGVALRGGQGGGEGEGHAAGTASEAVMLVDAGTRPLDASHPWRAFARKSFSPAVADALLACLAFDPRDRPRDTPRPC
jgi:serine/threonine protein kinase